MKVVVCQFDNRDGHLEGVLEKLRMHISENNADFLLLPEMCFSEWLAADPQADSARWHTSVATHEDRIAKLYMLGAKAVMSTRPIVRAGGSFRNQAYIWTPESGAQAVHEKYYLPDEEDYWEHTWYDRGERRFDLCRGLGMRIGVQICTEMWFFEWARHYAASKADLLCIPRATPHGSVKKWLAGGQAAAVCSGAYCLSSNLWAPPGDAANLGGLGWIISPEGDILAETDEDTPFATVEIDLEFARQSKQTYPRYVHE
jgi:N-carbamoylputrescine amidase